MRHKPQDLSLDDKILTASIGELAESPEGKQAFDLVASLLKIPARIHWLSIEPLLGKIVLPLKGIDWVVVGGESGTQRRDCGVDAIVSVVEQCKTGGVPVWVKQDCARFQGEQGRIPDDIWQIKELPI